MGYMLLNRKICFLLFVFLNAILKGHAEWKRMNSIVLCLDEMNLTQSSELRASVLLGPFWPESSFNLGTSGARSAGAVDPGFLLGRDSRWLHVALACQHFLDDEDVDVRLIGSQTGSQSTASLISCVSASTAGASHPVLISGRRASHPSSGSGACPDV